VDTDNTDFDDPTAANDIGGPGDTLGPAESLDSDDVRNDDGDEVVDPPDRWSEATKHGVTANEERAGESLDARLAEEEPDITAEPADGETVGRDESEQLVTDATLDRIDTEDHGADRGQIDGTPEDGDSIFPVVD
jgi:hypothetical protein